MSFDTSAYLRRATSRAKSDVANKLVSMFLHEVSRRLAGETGLSAADAAYANAVRSVFGSGCGYCSRPLEPDRAAIEHPDAMNRFRAGLHIPGNVIISCKRCNNEKRRDDGRPELVLAATGWESFLAHDSSRCQPMCKTCAYWGGIRPRHDERTENLRAARERIAQLRKRYKAAEDWAADHRPLLLRKLEVLYRECQRFATERIQTGADSLSAELISSMSPTGRGSSR